MQDYTHAIVFGSEREYSEEEIEHFKKEYLIRKVANNIANNSNVIQKDADDIDINKIIPSPSNAK